MIEFYPEIRLAHIAAVLASGGIFLLRGLAIFAGARWPLSMPVRLLSYTVDTVLLTAALMLMTLIEQYPFVHAWLTVKVLLLVVYIALGIIAFRKLGPPALRVGCWVAALAVYGFIISVARTHDPLGFLGSL